jgi:uncharacterized membrane protein YcgQ (UPF0703/DUF1980 family)
MAHSHLGCQSPKDYFTEQLLTILVCGGLGFVGVQLYMNDMLKHILAPQFHLPVLIGSVAVLVLVAVRAVSVWKEAGSLQPIDDMSCQENHVHTAACNHLPGLPAGTAADAKLVDDHGHSHDMAWVFVRMLVLAIPIVLFALGVPNSGFSLERQQKILGKEAAFNLSPKELEEMAKAPTTTELEPVSTQPDGSKVRVLKTKDGLKIREIVPLSGETKYAVALDAGIAMSFNELNDAAFDADKRAAYTGQTAILQGRFNKLTDKEFTLYRLKMTCCGADAVPLKVRIIAPQVPAASPGEWVKVRGVIRFIKAAGQDRYTPVLVLSDIKDVERNVEVQNEYEF